MHAVAPAARPLPCVCRELRARFAELERQLDAARKAQHAEAEHHAQLEGEAGRLQRRLAVAEASRNELSQQLWCVGLGACSACGPGDPAALPALPHKPPCLTALARSDVKAAHTALGSQHHALQEESRGLAAHNRQLTADLAAAQQRLQQAEVMGASLRAECAAGRQQQAGVREEGERLAAELQQVGA